MSTNGGCCRVCRGPMTPTSPLLSLFLMCEEENGSLSLGDMLEYVAGIVVSTEDSSISQQICVECLEQLKIAYRFRKKCLESDELLRATAVKDEVGDQSNSALQQAGFMNPTPSTIAISTVYLDNYDPKFYQAVEDRMYYMELHITTHRCCGCMQAFATMKDFKKHCVQVHANSQVEPLAPNQCPHCYSKFPYEEALNYHLEQANENIYCCRECWAVLENKQTLFGHLQLEHQISELELDMKQETGEPNQSLRVDRVLSFADTFDLGYCELSANLQLSHLRPSQYKVTERTDNFSIIEFSWHRCCACSYMFSSSDELDQHCTEVHRMSLDPYHAFAGPEKPFMCEKCWRRYKRKSLLTSHQKFNRKKIYVCNRCMVIFYGGPSYEKHVERCPGITGEVAKQDGSNQLTDGTVTHGDDCPMMVVPKQESDDDDVYILND